MLKNREDSADSPAEDEILKVRYSLDKFFLYGQQLAEKIPTKFNHTGGSWKKRTQKQHAASMAGLKKTVEIVSREAKNTHVTFMMRNSGEDTLEYSVTVENGVVNLAGAREKLLKMMEEK